MHHPIFYSLAGIVLALFLLVLLLLLHSWQSIRRDASRKRFAGLSPVDFPERTLLIAKDQPEYRTLPAHRKNDQQGTQITCWALSPLDRLKVLLTGRLWVSVYTFHQPLQPLFFSVNKSDLFEAELETYTEER